MARLAKVVNGTNQYSGIKEESFVERPLRGDLAEEKPTPPFWDGGTVGTWDVVGYYRRQIGLGCALLNESWPSTIVPGLSNHGFPLDPPREPFIVEAADQAWINAWKFWTGWGWLGYGITAVLTVMCGGEGAFMTVVNIIGWVFVIWPCLIFTVVALLARWRVGWPIMLVNLWLLTYIVKTILKWVLLVCGAVLVIRWLEGLFKRN